LRRTAEVEIRLPRLADGPPAIMALQIEQQFRFLGLAFIPVCHGRSRTNARAAISCSTK
jgi:hypothetical protein